MNTLLFVIITYCSQRYGGVHDYRYPVCVARVTECSQNAFRVVNEDKLAQCLIKEGK